MDMEMIVDAVRRFEGALVVVPDAGGPRPELSWGGWVSVVNPQSRTAGTMVALLRGAHQAAQERAKRRVR